MNAHTSIVAAATPAGAWTQCKAAFDAARAAEIAYDKAVWTPDYDAAVAAGRQVDAAINTEAERLQDVRCAAEDALIACPAPSLAETVWKVVYARGRWAGFTDWPDKWWEAVLADLHRFAAPCSHAKWLRERDDLLRVANTTSGISDSESEFYIARADAIEDLIFDTPARDPDAVFAKALLVVGRESVADDGGELAARVFSEAQALGLIEYAA